MSAWTITEDSARKFTMPVYEDSGSLEDKSKIGKPKSDHVQFDEKFAGFGLRIRRDPETGNEHRSYIFQYKIGSKHRRLNCGAVGKVSADDARRAAKKHAAALINHEDPANKKEVARAQASHTIGATIADYLEAKRAEMAPTAHDADNKRFLERFWKPLHGLSLGGVARANVATELRRIAKDSGPVAANRSRSTAVCILSVGNRRGAVTKPTPLLAPTSKRKTHPASGHFRTPKLPLSGLPPPRAIMATS